MRVLAVHDAGSQILFDDNGIAIAMIFTSTTDIRVTPDIILLNFDNSAGCCGTNDGPFRNSDIKSRMICVWAFWIMIILCLGFGQLGRSGKASEPELQGRPWTLHALRLRTSVHPIAGRPARRTHQGPTVRAGRRGGVRPRRPRHRDLPVGAPSQGEPGAAREPPQPAGGG